ncbi:MAG: hypothetical protein AMXMBFR7_42960 [Planctomycetota bacterium]
MYFVPLGVTRLISLGVGLCLLPLVLHGSEQPYPMQDWVPPTASQWTSLRHHLLDAYGQARKKDPKLGGGVLQAPMVSVDRTNGWLYAFPQYGALWLSTDRGQTFEWLNREVRDWGFNESPTSMCISPEGSKLRIFSSQRSGFSLDGGKTWKYMNFTINFGFEDGLINWDGKGDGKMIVARSHTWPHARMWFSRDAGASFTECSPEITKQINTQTMALMDDDVLLFCLDAQYPYSKLLRTEDYGKTVVEVPIPVRGADGKMAPGTFQGLSRRFKDKVYWLHSTGVYTSSDKGLTWTVVGKPFPSKAKGAKEWGPVRSGPLFGKDENHMLVLFLNTVVETLDGGQTWHVLAELPVSLTYQPWGHSFAYDPLGDVLYCNNRHHHGGPNLFGRLALKRWGDVEKVLPSAPAGIQANIVRGGNCAELSWKPSSDASGIYAYYVYVDGTLQYRTEQPGIVLSNLAWGQELKVGVQAVDAWQNRSAVVEVAVRLGAKPAQATLLQDLPRATATFDGAPMDIVTAAADKPGQSLAFRMDGYEPNPVPEYARRKMPYGLGVQVKKTHKQGVLEYALDQKYTRLLLEAGMYDSQWEKVRLRILLDGKEVYATKPASYGTLTDHIGRKPEPVDLDLANVKTLRFEITVTDAKHLGLDMVVLGNAMLFARE